MTKQRVVPTQPALAEASAPKSTFPLVQYGSLLGIHVILLLFVALFLPRSSAMFLELPVSPPLDRPNHPFLEPITQNPVLTLTWLCFGTAILQASWAGSMRKLGWPQSTAAELEQRVSRGGRKTRAWLATVGMGLIYSLIIVLFGAPITSHHTHTITLGLLVSLLTVYVPVYILGVPSLSRETQALAHRLTFVRLFAEQLPITPAERALVYPVVGAVIGCWAGAFPIALDWDRPWQAWPLTPAYGSIFGYIVGSLYSLAISILHFLAYLNMSHKTERKSK